MLFKTEARLAAKSFLPVTSLCARWKGKRKGNKKMRMATFLRPEVLTMRTSTKNQPTIRLHEVKTEGRRIHLHAELEVDLPMPAQDEHLPAALERAVDDAGQRLKRLLCQQALEQADLQLLLRHLRGKRGEKSRRRGSAGYTFKTVFGTVKVRRSRLENKDTGAT